MSAEEELWIPLVDEPIGGIVDDIQREHPEIGELVSSPRRILAFKTFAYIRAGKLLGELLFDSDAEPEERGRWVEHLLEQPGNKAKLVAEIRAVAEEVAADPRYRDEEPLGPDDDARARFREFARKQLGS